MNNPQFSHSSLPSSTNLENEPEAKRMYQEDDLQQFKTSLGIILSDIISGITSENPNDMWEVWYPMIEEFHFLRSIQNKYPESVTPIIAQVDTLIKLLDPELRLDRESQIPS